MSGPGLPGRGVSRRSGGGQVRQGVELAIPRGGGFGLIPGTGTTGTTGTTGR